MQVSNTGHKQNVYVSDPLTQYLVQGTLCLVVLKIQFRDMLEYENINLTIIRSSI